MRPWAMLELTTHDVVQRRGGSSMRPWAMLELTMHGVVRRKRNSKRPWALFNVGDGVELTKIIVVKESVW